MQGKKSSFLLHCARFFVTLSRKEHEVKDEEEEHIDYSLSGM